jgi:catalase
MRRTATQWLLDAFAHVKFIGFTQPSTPLLDAAQIDHDAVGIVDVSKTLSEFLTELKQHRVWDRESA